MGVRRRTWLWVVGIVAVLAVVAAYIDHRFVNLADASFAKARGYTSATTTYLTAKDWLEANDFHVITTPAGEFVGGFAYKNPGASAAPNNGYRPQASTFLLWDRWMQIDFFFTENGEFVRVKLDPRATPPPRWSVPRTR